MIPLLLPRCQHSTIRTENQSCSQSLDASVRVHNNCDDSSEANCNTNCNNNNSNSNNFPYKYDSVNTINKSLSAILLPPLPLPLSYSVAQLKCGKSFLCQNLNCIDKNESLELIEEENDVDDDDGGEIKLKFLQPTYNPTVKRQSEPNIQYSFVNRGFEAAAINTIKHFSSQNDIAEVNFYNDENDYDDDDTDLENLKPKTYNEKRHYSRYFTKPKITINNVYGEEIDHRLDSSDSLDSPDTMHIANDHKNSEHQRHHKSHHHQHHHNRKKRIIIREASIYNYNDSIDADDSFENNLKEDSDGDGLNISDINGDYNDGDDDVTIYENVKMCGKCGHKSLKL